MVRWYCSNTASKRCGCSTDATTASLIVAATDVRLGGCWAIAVGRRRSSISQPRRGDASLLDYSTEPVPSTGEVPGDGGSGATLGDPPVVIVGRGWDVFGRRKRRRGRRETAGWLGRSGPVGSSMRDWSRCRVFDVSTDGAGLELPEWRTPVSATASSSTCSWCAAPRRASPSPARCVTSPPWPPACTSACGSSTSATSSSSCSCASWPVRQHERRHLGVVTPLAAVLAAPARCGPPTRSGRTVRSARVRVRRRARRAGRRPRR